MLHKSVVSAFLAFLALAAASSNADSLSKRDIPEISRLNRTLAGAPSCPDVSADPSEPLSCYGVFTSSESRLGETLTDGKNWEELIFRPCRTAARGEGEFGTIPESRCQNYEARLKRKVRGHQACARACQSFADAARAEAAQFPKCEMDGVVKTVSVHPAAVIDDRNAMPDGLSKTYGAISADGSCHCGMELWFRR